MKYEQYRRELISSVSHDLRTPLTAIRGYVSGILDGVADTPEKQRKYLLAVQARALDLENLISQLSAYNKMENHQFRYQMEPVSLSEFVRGYLEENEEFIRRNRLEITLDARGGDRLLMDWDWRS